MRKLYASRSITTLRIICCSSSRSFLFHLSERDSDSDAAATTCSIWNRHRSVSSSQWEPGNYRGRMLQPSHCAGGGHFCFVVKRHPRSSSDESMSLLRVRAPPVLPVPTSSLLTSRLLRQDSQEAIKRLCRASKPPRSIDGTDWSSILLQPESGPHDVFAETCDSLVESSARTVFRFQDP